MTDTTDNELGHRRRVLELSTEIADLLRDIVDRAKDYHELGVPAREWLDLVAAELPNTPASLIAWSAEFIAPAIDYGLGVLAGSVGAAKASKSSPRHAEVIGGGSTDVDELDLILAREFATLCVKHQEAEGKPHSDLANLSRCFVALDDAEISHNEHAHTIRMRQVIGRLFAEAPKLEGADVTQAPAMDVHILLRGAPMQFSGILSTTAEGTLKLLTPVPKEACMVEQFFDYADVTSIALVRKVQASESGSRIITS